MKYVLEVIIKYVLEVIVNNSILKDEWFGIFVIYFLNMIRGGILEVLIIYYWL